MLVRLAGGSGDHISGEAAVLGEDEQAAEGAAGAGLHGVGEADDLRALLEGQWAKGRWS